MAVHLGVWNAEPGVARAIADTVNTVTVIRIRAATRFNGPSVGGSAPVFSKRRFSVVFPSLCGDASLVGRARKAYLWMRNTARSLCGHPKGCLIPIVQPQPQQSAETFSRGRFTRSLLFPARPGARARGVGVAFDPVEFHGFSDRYDDKKGGR